MKIHINTFKCISNWNESSYRISVLVWFYCFVLLLVKSQIALAVSFSCIHASIHRQMMHFQAIHRWISHQGLLYHLDLLFHSLLSVLQSLFSVINFCSSPIFFFFFHKRFSLWCLASAISPKHCDI